MNNTFQRMRTLAVSGSLMHRRPDNSDMVLSEYYYFNPPIKSVLFFVFILLIAVSVTGNALVLTIIFKYPKMRTRTNLLLGNLSVIDLLTGLVAMPFSLITLYNGTWVLGEIACQVNGFVNALFVAASIHTLMYISIHKYFVIRDIFLSTMKRRYIVAMISATWIWGFVFAGALVSGWTVIEYKNGTTQCGPKVPDAGNWLEASHSIFTSITNFFLPLAIITFCYFSMFRNFRQYLRIISQKFEQINAEEERANVLRKRKIVITLLIVLISFLLCVAPYIAYSSSIAFLKDRVEIPGVLNPIAYIFLFLSSCTNPIIYALRSHSFAIGYRDLCFCCCEPKPFKPHKSYAERKKPYQMVRRKTNSTKWSRNAAASPGGERERSFWSSRSKSKASQDASKRGRLLEVYRPEKSTIQEERSSQMAS